MTIQTLMVEKTVQLEEVQALASRLAPLDKIKLLERIAAMLEDELVSDHAMGAQETEQAITQTPKPRRSLLGLWAPLGAAPSAEDIEKARREMWANFPRGDI